MQDTEQNNEHITIRLTEKECNDILNYIATSHIAISVYTVDCPAKLGVKKLCACIVHLSENERLKNYLFNSILK